MVQARKSLVARKYDKYQNCMVSHLNYLTAVEKQNVLMQYFGLVARKPDFFIHVNNKYAYQTAHVVRLSHSLFACFIHIPLVLYADPESFVRGVSSFGNVFLVYEGSGGSKYHYKRAIIGPPAI